MEDERQTKVPREKNLDTSEEKWGALQTGQHLTSQRSGSVAPAGNTLEMC